MSRFCNTQLNWIEHGLTSPPTQYRLYGRRVAIAILQVNFTLSITRFASNKQFCLLRQRFNIFDRFCIQKITESCERVFRTKTTYSRCPAHRVSCLVHSQCCEWRAWYKQTAFLQSIPLRWRQRDDTSRFCLVASLMGGLFAFLVALLQLTIIVLCYTVHCYGKINFFHIQTKLDTLVTRGIFGCHHAKTVKRTIYSKNVGN